METTRVQGADGYRVEIQQATNTTRGITEYMAEIWQKNKSRSVAITFGTTHDDAHRKARNIIKLLQNG